MERKLSILLIEDDAIEIMKVNRTISSIGLPHQIVEARDGEVALEILKKRDQLPDIIFLDLQTPKISGIEVLRILKADPMLKYLPTIVLNTMANHKEILECFKIGITGYFIKSLKY